MRRERRAANQTNAKDRQNLFVVGGLLMIALVLMLHPASPTQSAENLLFAIVGGLLTFLNTSQHQETGSTNVNAANVENVTAGETPTPERRGGTQELSPEDVPAEVQQQAKRKQGGG